ARGREERQPAAPPTDGSRPSSSRRRSRPGPRAAGRACQGAPMLFVRERLALTCVLFAAACSGQIGEGAAPGETPAGGSGPSGAGGAGPRGGIGPGMVAGAGGTGGTGPAACTSGALPWLPTPLTREQYIHAASELLGFDVRPLATFSDVGGRR